MLNKINLVGRLTKDPELRFISTGTAVATFTVAVDRRFKNKQGEKETDFIPIVVWSKQAEFCANYLGKGRLVAISGRLQVRTYEAQDGQKKWVTEVVAEEVYGLDRGESRPNTSGSNPSPSDSQNQEGDFYPVEEDDLPF